MQPSCFAGKTALVTGAASGLGRALSLELAGSGANLVLSDRNQESLLETHQLCAGAGASVSSLAVDVTRPEECGQLTEQAVSRFGAIDYLLANAGVSMWARFEDTRDLTIFRKLVEVNYLGVLYCSYYALPYLRQSKGVLVAICSIQGRVGVPFHSGYSASKHALHGILASLRCELVGSGVDILAVYPHWIQGTRLRENAFGTGGENMGASVRKHTRQAITLEQCTQAILRAISRRQRELVIPAKLKALLWLNLISPRLVEKIVNSKVDENR